MSLSQLVRLLPCLAVASAGFAVAPTVHADEPRDAASVLARGVTFLKETQTDEGWWSLPDRIGFTGVATVALLEAGLTADDPAVAKGLAYLLRHRRPDGGIYGDGSSHRNYETCLAVLAMTQADADRYRDEIAAADAFLRGLQWDEGEGLTSADYSFGGAGYGRHARPDMSNTQFLVEALRSAGAGPDDEAMQNALLFVARTQNLEGSNDTKFGAKIDDGGFYYTPAAGGESKAGVTPNGGLRSYASMTYAGLKSFLYAGVDADDRRVRAAAEWARRNYRLDENPGMGLQGLYYYYQVFAKAHAALGEPLVITPDGRAHDWRQDLVTELANRQRADGSWINAADRWYEGDPALVTGYAVLALSKCVTE
ncbi:MAG: hypothetical protein AAF532_05900 [Planctomycetota bacterium]